VVQIAVTSHTTGLPAFKGIKVIPSHIIIIIIIIIIIANQHKAAGVKIEAKQMRNGCKGALIR